MVNRDAVSIFDSDLPLVRQILPWPFRVALLAFGLFAIAMPAWELGRGLWPINIATPVFAVIIVGGASIGVRMVAAGLSGWRYVWTYPPGAILIQRRSWGRETTIRLRADQVAAVEVRRLEHADDDPWQVVVVPRPTSSALAVMTADAGRVFAAGSYGSQAYARRVRDALVAHLGL